MSCNQNAVSRRRFVQATAASSLALAGFGRSGFAQVAKPNIVFILADDLGICGPELLRSTRLHDAERGPAGGRRTQVHARLFEFRQLLANPHRPGHRALSDAPRGGPRRTNQRRNAESVGLPPSHPTLPSLLKKAGYGTSLVGKWHLGFLPDYSPLKSGYDRFFGIFGGAADYFNHGPDASRSGPEAGQLHEQEVPVERHGYMTNLLGDRAVETIEGYAKSKEPFLLSLHFTAPHWPWEGPDDEAESKRIRSIFHRDGGTQKTYMAMMQSLDGNIGRVLQALDVHGLSANTVVIFTSDNGGERFSNIWPFSGMKGELLEGGLRIPAIVRWPGRIPAGAVSEQVMISMDWLPTLLAAAGTQPDPSYPSDGDNLLPIVTGRASPHPRKLFWRFKAGVQRAVRDGDWKYLQIAGNEFLFDVVKDPRERANLKDRYKDVFDRLKKDWASWNSTMLPERPRPAAYSNPGNFLADHYGVTNPAPAAQSGNTPTR